MHRLAMIHSLPTRVKIKCRISLMIIPHFFALLWLWVKWQRLSQFIIGIVKMVVMIKLHAGINEKTC